MNLDKLEVDQISKISLSKISRACRYFRFGKHNESLKLLVENLLEEEKSKEELEIKNPEINKILDELELTLKSLNYKNKEIKTILPILFKEVDSLTTKEKKISFENLLKYAMNHLDSDCSNRAR